MKAAAQRSTCPWTALRGAWRGRILAIVLALGVSSSCQDDGNDCGVGSRDFPRICKTDHGPQCPGDPFAICMVTGLFNHMVDVTAPPPLRARIRVGERVTLTQHCVGCLVAPVSYSWTSTSPGVASFAPIGGGTGSFLIDLVGVSPGETNVYVDLTFPAGSGISPYRANLAHCTTISLSQCNNPQRITPIEVVAQ